MVMDLNKMSKINNVLEVVQSISDVLASIDQLHEDILKINAEGTSNDDLMQLVRISGGDTTAVKRLLDVLFPEESTPAAATKASKSTTKKPDKKKSPKKSPKKKPLMPQPTVVDTVREDWIKKAINGIGIEDGIVKVHNIYPDATVFELFNIRYRDRGRSTVGDINAVIRGCINMGINDNDAIATKLLEECNLPVTYRQIFMARTAKK